MCVCGPVHVSVYIFECLAAYHSIIWSTLSSFLSQLSVILIFLFFYVFHFVSMLVSMSVLLNVHQILPFLTFFLFFKHNSCHSEIFSSTFLYNFLFWLLFNLLILEWNSVQGYNDGTLSSSHFYKPVSLVRGSNQTIWILDDNRVRIITLNVTFDIAFSTERGISYIGSATNTATRTGPGTRTGSGMESGMGTGSGTDVPLSMTTTKGSVSTLAGSTIQGEKDGTGKFSTFFEPSGVYVSSTDGIGYVSDTSSCHIRRITPTSIVTPLISCDTMITSLIRPSGCTSYDQVIMYFCQKYFYLFYC